MELTQRVENGICIIEIIGELAVNNANTFKEKVMPMVEEEAIKGIILNFKDTSMLDSYGIGVIIKLFQTMQKKQKKLVLCEVNSLINKVLRVTRLDKVLTIFNVEKDALTFFQEA